MITFTQPDSNQVDYRKSPLLTTFALFAMTTISPTQPNITVNFPFVANGAYSGSSKSSIDSAGMFLFVQEQLEYQNKNKKTHLAESLGIQLPYPNECLPDETIDYLQNLGITPDFINPTQEGGLMIEFQAEGVYHMVEFFSDGDIVFLKRGAKATEAWDLTSSNYLPKLKSELAFEAGLELV